MRSVPQSGHSTPYPAVSLARLRLRTLAVAVYSTPAVPRVEPSSRSLFELVVCNLAKPGPFDIPSPGAGIWKPIFGNGSTDLIVYARSAAPVKCGNRIGSVRLPIPRPFSGAASVQRPNLVSGVPLWIADPNVAGGKEINPGAFSALSGRRKESWDDMPCANSARLRSI